MTLKNNEKKALKDILIGDSAASVIKRALSFRRKNHASIAERQEAWELVRNNTKSFNKLREEICEEPDENEVKITDLSKRMTKIERELENIKISINLVLEKVTQLN